MNKQVAEALEGAIKKWQKIVDYLAKKIVDWTIVKELEQGCGNCPLCQMFKLCGGCPVFKKTEKMACMETPYIDFANAKSLRNLKIARESAKAEVKFLKSLRDKP